MSTAKTASVEVRSRSDGDVPACLALLRDVQRTDRYPSTVTDLAAFLLPEHEIAAWVAAVDGNVLGHVALHQPPTSATIDLVATGTAMPFERHAVVSRLFVAPQARGRGLARSLLRTALEQARADRLRAVLDVGHDFTAAIALYEAEGWSRFGGDRQAVGNETFDVWLYVSPPSASS